MFRLSTLLSIIALLPTSSSASEGFFDPFTFTVPESIDRQNVIFSTVRIRENMWFHFNLFAEPEAADEWNSRPDIYEADGRVIKHVGYLNSRRDACGDPNFSLKPIAFEFCKLVQSNSQFPAMAPIEGAGTGVMVSADGYILTNYHVAMDCINRAGRQSGRNDVPPVVCPDLRVEIPEGKSPDGTIQYRVISEVWLVASSSESETFLGPATQTDPKMGLDAALLKVNAQPEEYMEIACDAPGAYEPIWMFGHPIRSARPEQRRKLLGYEDADNSQRLSVGFYIGANADHTFLSDLDGLPGNSGSAAINKDGKIVGLISTFFGDRSEIFSSYGAGNPQHVKARSICDRFDVRNRYSGIAGCACK